MLALFACCIGLIFPAGEKVLFVFCSLLFGGAYEITKFLAGLPGAVFYTPAFSALGVVLYYFLVMSLFFNSAWKNKFFSWGSLYKKQILVCLGLFLIAFCFWRSRPANNFRSLSDRKVVFPRQKPRFAQTMVFKW